MDNNHEQLKKLSRIFNADKLVTVDDIAEVLKGIIGILANNRKENVALNAETKGVVNDLLQKSIQENNKLLSAIDGRTSKMKKEVTAEFSAKLNEVKSLLKEVEKKKPKDGKDADEEIIVEKVLAQIELPKYKETILDGRPEIVTKINSGAKDDTQISLKQIENGSKLLTQAVLDRAIGILDQRSQFLISKVSNLQSQVDSAQISVGAIGGAITGGTAGSVLFVNPTGIIAQDNANFFWDNTNNRLGIGTNTPGEKLDVAGNIQSGGYFIMTSDNDGLAGAGGPVGTWIRPKEPNSTFGQILINASGVTSFYDSAGNVQVIFNNGDVGIGTSAPTTLLSLERGGSGEGTVPGLRLSTVGASIGDGPAIDFYFGNLNRIGRIYGVAVNSNRGDIRIATSNVSGFSDILTLTTAGKVGIGTTSPSAKLHLAAGTAVASTAPLKFTSGALLTAAEAGAVEYLTDAYYVTTTTNAIRRMVVAGSLGRATAQNAANASVATYTLGATDASYEVSMNVLITTSTLFSFTCECAYTDEGNTARVITLNFTTLAGVISNAALTNAGGAVPYEGVPIHIRCKASTAITLRTQAVGTYTTVTYNIEGNIKQIG